MTVFHLELVDLAVELRYPLNFEFLHLVVNNHEVLMSHISVQVWMMVLTWFRGFILNFSCDYTWRRPSVSLVDGLLVVTVTALAAAMTGGHGKVVVVDCHNHGAISRLVETLDMSSTNMLQQHVPPPANVFLQLSQWTPGCAGPCCCGAAGDDAMSSLNILLLCRCC